LVAPRLVPGPLLASTLAITLLIILREPHGVRWRDLGWALAGRIFGIAAAVYILAVLPAADLAILSAIFVLIAVVITAWGLKVAPHPGILASAGLVSGLIGTVVAIGGPAIALVYQHESGPRIRATLSAYFFAGIVLSLVALAWAGRFGLHDLALGGLLVPAVLVGYLGSSHVARVLDRGYVRPAILLLSAAASVAVLVKQIW
jgi:uncharacterized membrane protein YfcA